MSPCRRAVCPNPPAVAGRTGRRRRELVGDVGLLGMMFLGCQDGLDEVGAHPLVAAQRLAVGLDLEIQAFGKIRLVALLPGQRQVQAFASHRGLERVAPARRLGQRRPQQGLQVGQARGRQAVVQDGHGQHRAAGQQFATRRGGQELSGAAVEHVELEEVVRQRVVEHRVFFRQRFAVHHVAVFQPLQQPAGVGLGPGLDEVELAFAPAAHQVVAARLQQQVARGAETDAGVGAIEFLLHHQAQAAQLAVGLVVVAVVAFLQPRAFQVRGAGVAEQFKGLRAGAEIRRHGSSPGKVGKPTTRSCGEGKRGGMCCAFRNRACRGSRSRPGRSSRVNGQADRDYRKVVVGV